MPRKCSFYQVLPQLFPFHPPSPACLPTSLQALPDAHHPLLIWHPSYTFSYSSTEMLQLGPYSQLCLVTQYYWFTSVRPWISRRWLVSAHLGLHLPHWEGYGDGEGRHKPNRDQLKPKPPPQPWFSCSSWLTDRDGSKPGSFTLVLRNKICTDRNTQCWGGRIKRVLFSLGALFQIWVNLDGVCQPRPQPKLARERMFSEGPNTK